MSRDRVKKKASDIKRLEDLRKNAIDSISIGGIIDLHNWDLWCNIIKRCAEQKKYPYSDDFTNDIIFEMMILGCFYCGQLATTIDRVDSTLDHTRDNCVGCCHGCNVSKGASDSATFIRKAYYRTRGKYIDNNTNIWFDKKQKPIMWKYTKSAEKKGVPFELTKKEFDVLIKGECEYCKRRPTSWFGIDREIPHLGYVLGNVVPCCFDCNNDKHVDDILMVNARNERIADRVDTGELVIDDCPQVILHQGTQKTSKKVCAYGKVYSSKSKASRTLGKNDNYVCQCIRTDRYSDDIFEIIDVFYEEYKDSELYITKNMCICFEYFYHE
jgi:5-methylcytosine-specific restriction endonuclease McrA